MMCYKCKGEIGKNKEVEDDLNFYNWCLPCYYGELKRQNTDIDFYIDTYARKKLIYEKLINRIKNEHPEVILEKI